MNKHNSMTSECSIPARAAARFWQATMSRDARADGTFVLAVRSTHIYCRPSCPARRPLRRNVLFFRTGEEAEKHGFRACLRCKPNEIAGPVALVQAASRELAESRDDTVRFGALAAKLALHARDPAASISSGNRFAPARIGRSSTPCAFQKNATRRQEHHGRAV